MAWAAVSAASNSAFRKFHLTNFTQSHDEQEEDGMELASSLSVSKPSKPIITKDGRQYTGEELDEYRQIFNLFDKDKSGFISAAELGEATSALGMEYSKRDLERIVEEVDQDGNGAIDFSEFCNVLKMMTQKQSNWEEIIKQCFDVFDRNANGMVTESEFRHILYNVGDIKDEELIEELFSEYDIDGSGSIEFEEFSNFVRDYLTDADVDGQ